MAAVPPPTKPSAVASICCDASDGWLLDDSHEIVEGIRDIVSQEMKGLVTTVVRKLETTIRTLDAARTKAFKQQQFLDEGELLQLKKENQELRSKLRAAEQERRAREMDGGRARAKGAKRTMMTPVTVPLPLVESIGSDQPTGTGNNSLQSSTPMFPDWEGSSAATSFPGIRRMVVFTDLSPECDDECALLYMLAELNNNKTQAIIDLIATDSDIRFFWMQYLFKEKLKEGGGWKLGFDGTFFTMGTVTIHMYILKSQRESMVIEDFKKKVPAMFDKDEEVRNNGFGGIQAADVSEVPGGRVDAILMAAPVPQLDPGFFSRFEGVRGTYVVGTPGGVNCPQPSWSSILFSLHELGPVVYLAPQFTRMVRFPKDYVEDNPHWPWYMKRTVFDSALTVMARRPEIPAKFGDWGLILRLNAANAKICEGWYQDVMGRPMDSSSDAVEATIRTRVQAYVERNSGTDRRFGAVAEELRMVGKPTAAELDDNGQPLSEEDVEILRSDYRSALFDFVAKCVTTAETLVFQNQANLKATAGEHNFLTLHPRCGYSDPHANLANVFGPGEAIEIVKSLPLKSLTPAYDMVGAICMLSYLDSGEIDSMGLDVREADAKLGAALFTDKPDKSIHPIYVVGDQDQEVVDAMTDWLRKHIETDPLVLLDDFWAKYRLNHNRTEMQDALTSNTPSRARIGQWTSSRMSPMFTDQSVEFDGASPEHWTDCVRCLIVHPSSNKLLVWALISMLFVLYDLVAVPMQAFDYQDPGWILWCSAVFWLLDLLFTFFKGFYLRGIVEMRPMKVFKHYFKTWFLLDLSIVATDWLMLLWFSGDNNLVVLLRTRRAIRLARLLKVSKMDRIMNHIRDVFPGAHVDYSLKIAKMMFLIFFVTHAIACGWYLIGKETDSSSVVIGNWIDKAGIAGTTDMALEYSMSMHWAFAHLLLGEMDVPAVNKWERMYSIGILMMGLLIFSYFVSSITEYMARIAETQAEAQRQDSEVQRFMEDHGISALLTAQIDRYRRHARSAVQKTMLPRESIEGLQDIPETLSMWLSREVYGLSLATHGCFELMADKAPDSFAEAVHRMMREVCFTRGAEIFTKGTKVNFVYIFNKGEAEYQRDDIVRPLEKDTWVSEYALWLGGWKRRGDLCATGYCELNSLDLEEFKRVCSEKVDIGYIACEFAELVANSKVHFSKLHDIGLDMDSRKRFSVGLSEAMMEAETSGDPTYSTELRP